MLATKKRPQQCCEWYSSAKTNRPFLPAVWRQKARCLAAKGPLFVGKSTTEGYKQQGYRHVFVAQALSSSSLSLLLMGSCFPMHKQLQPTNAGNEKQTSRHTLALNYQTTHAHTKLKYFPFFTKHTLFPTSF